MQTGRNGPVRWKLLALYRAQHICSGQFYFQEYAATFQGSGHIFQIEESSERSRGRDGADEEPLVFQETPLCQSIPGWQGSRENLETYRRSAGSNMCLHYNLHCNQNVRAD